MKPHGTMFGSVQRRRILSTSGGSGSHRAFAAGSDGRANANARLWAALAAPGIVWLLLFFLAPLYVVLCIVFGQVDPLFRTAVPVWNPLQWDPTQFTYVLTHIVGAERRLRPALLRTVIYVGVGQHRSAYAIAFPVAYYVARLAGKRKGLLLALLIAPFWISYMMRMFAWVNLLQNDGLFNRLLSLGGLFDLRRGLADRPAGGGDPRVGLRLRAVHDPAALRRPRPAVDSRCWRHRETLAPTAFSSFLRVTLPLCRPTIVAAVLLTCLPMLGDYFTNDCSPRPRRPPWSGNLINDSVQAPGQTGQAGAFVMLVFLVARAADALLRSR